MNTVIDIQHIQMKFKEKVALRDVSLQVSQGEILGLLGPSGSGKTTLINILTGQLQPSEGSATLFNCDSRNLHDDVFDRIGMVLDKSGIYDRLNCYDNLLLYTRLHKLPRNRILTVLNDVGLHDCVKLTCSKLSKGMMQRFILARAILHKPDLLFLDEPTSGLDPLTAKQIHILIKQLEEQGTTIFLTTHNMEEASKLCDHVALLHEGKIVEYGIPQDLCRKYDTEHKIIITTKDNRYLEFVNTPEHAQTIADYFTDGMVKEIHSIQPNLETVFLQLTGRKLEEYVNL